MINLEFAEELTKILIINCSPVRNCATAEIVNIVKDNLSAENEVRSICIDDYEIAFCKGCRACHKTAQCFQKDDVIKIMEQYEWADIPGQFKVFIDRCTPWCNTHESYAKLSAGKKGYTIALRTGSSMPECERIIRSVEYFHGHLEIESCGKLGLCSIEYKEDVATRIDEIKEFCNIILS